MTTVDTVNTMDRTSDIICARGAIYAARQTGLYRFNSAGDNPQNLFDTWLPEQTIPTLAVASDGGDLLLAGINGGIARSEDGGQSWEAIQFRAPAPLVTCLALSPYFADDGCVLAGSYEDGVFRSTDGGKTWQVCNHGLFDHSVYCLALSPDFARDGIVYAGVGSGVYRSVNGGRVWGDLTTPAGDEAALCLALSPDFERDQTVYAGTEAHGLLRSGDSGETWATVLETRGAVNSIAVAGSRIIMQVDDAALQSLDGGANWAQVFPSDVECLTVGDDAETLILALADGSVRLEAL